MISQKQHREGEEFEINRLKDPTNGIEESYVDGLATNNGAMILESGDAVVLTAANNGIIIIDNSDALDTITVPAVADIVAGFNFTVMGKTNPSSFVISDSTSFLVGLVASASYITTDKAADFTLTNPSAIFTYQGAGVWYVGGSAEAIT